MSLYTVIYVSAAKYAMNKRELTNLLAICRLNNQKLGVTGMLLYKEGQFMQVLEGEESDVVELHKIIAHDERHQYVTTIYSAPIRERSFLDWSMGFKDLNEESVKEVEGYTDFLNTSFDSDHFRTDTTSAFRLLNMFKSKTA